MPGLAPRTAYELWADSYPASAHNPVMRAEQSVVEPLLARLGSPRSSRALDVGTGSGRYLPLLRAAGARVVVGVDFSIGMLRSGIAPPGTGPKARAASAPAIRICGDAMRLPFRRSAFDLVNASLMVGDIADLRAWTSEVARVLARGGQLVYSDFHPTWADNGWRRTFRTAQGDEHEIAIEAHSIDDHLAAIEAAGLTPLAIREPRIRDDEADPGVRAFRRRWGNPPVVAVFHAIKESQ